MRSGARTLNLTASLLAGVSGVSSTYFSLAMGAMALPVVSFVLTFVGSYDDGQLAPPQHL